MSDAIKKLFDDEYLETMLVLRKDWDKPEEDAVWEFCRNRLKIWQNPVNPL